MKYLILTLVLTITSAHAQLTKGLEVLTGSATPVAECEGCADDATCPQNIVRDVLNGPLTFMGRDLLPGSDQNRSCVFRGPTAYVVYTNCMGSKREAAATDITVIPFTGGMIEFYVENSTDTPISTMQRSQYDSTWRVSFQPTPVPGTLNMDGIKTYLRATQSRSNGGCYIGNSFAARDMSQQATCYGGYQNQMWSTQAREFWQDPGAQWTPTLQRLRETVNRSY